jgi:hypothetical protein
VEAELLHVDGQTDITKLTVAFRNSVNGPNNASIEVEGYEIFTVTVPAADSPL